MPPVTFMGGLLNAEPTVPLVTVGQVTLSDPGADGVATGGIADRSAALTGAGGVMAVFAGVVGAGVGAGLILEILTLIAACACEKFVRTVKAKSKVTMQKKLEFLMGELLFSTALVVNSVKSGFMAD